MKIGSWPADIVPYRFSDSDAEVDTAMVRLGDNGYELVLNRSYFESLPESEQEAVLDHEMAHIIRGDLVSPRLRSNPRLWNVCTDAVINEYLRGRLPEGAVMLEQVAPELWRDGAPPPSAEAVWDALVRREREQSGASAEGQNGSERREGGDESDNRSGPGAEGGESGASTTNERQGGHDTIVVTASPERAATEHVKTVWRLSARGFSIDEATARPSPGSQSAPTMEKAARKVFESLLHRRLQEQYGAAKVRCRSWMRPARNEHIAGRSRSRRGRIAVCIDVSGSMDSIVTRAMAFARYSARIADVEVWVWASAAQRLKNKSERYSVGCGTDPKALFESLRKDSYDAIVIVTDGEFEQLEMDDMKGLAPITWVIIGYEQGRERGRNNRSRIASTVYLRNCDRSMGVRRSEL